MGKRRDDGGVCGICGRHATRLWPEWLSGACLLGTYLCDGCKEAIDSGVTEARAVIGYSDRYWASSVSRGK